jgi:hypothetical protein
LRDARNVLNTASTYFSEVRSVSLNIDGSNTSVIRKGDPLPYVNWNRAEGLPMWRYGHDLTKSIHDIVD